MAGNIRFLKLSRVLAIHHSSTKHYGGDPGIRDIGLLQSAIAMPQSMFAGHYLHATLHEMASAYLFHICANHPFVDGNKRTSAMTAIIFLDLNGIEVTASQSDLVDLVLGVAEGRTQKPEITEFFQANTKPRA
ncbi:type II toxin-antitoxin system death-on-curing family toxin [Bremerella sp. P1]|uniref:type II toxin-antitoxin system death-on-curing family toxin n=1 Tax=Bremerella sp. P1 TaxID=3026424 RepID=UPI002368AAEA|nr:type II toxin-antitoxin system death-on-curing family toxin [Bremerella sp. P1]WDI45028.1 type II toxin-antitoxin system death-on-curing family toxin [Bremerella sp. P1]